MAKWKKERLTGGDWRINNRLTAGYPFWGAATAPGLGLAATENPLWTKGGMIQ